MVFAGPGYATLVHGTPSMEMVALAVDGEPKPEPVMVMMSLPLMEQSVATGPF